MNAYELADALENDWHGGFVIESADMLRQQADRIAELEKDNKELHAIAQRMAMAESDARKSLQNFKDHPVKQLSDEEIGQIFADNLSFVVRTKEDADNLIFCARAIIKEITE